MRSFLLWFAVVVVVLVAVGCSVVPKQQYRFEQGDVLADGRVPEVGALAYLDDQGLATDEKEDASGEPYEPLMVVDGQKIDELTGKVQAAGSAAPPPWGMIIGIVVGVLGLGGAGAVTISNALKKKKAGIKKAAETAVAGSAET